MLTHYLLTVNAQCQMLKVKVLNLLLDTLNKDLQTICFVNHNAFRSVNSTIQLGLCSINSSLHPSFLFSP